MCVCLCEGVCVHASIFIINNICGFSLVGRHCEIYKDPCLKMHCQNGGSCLVVDGEPYCDCSKTEYKGRFCNEGNPVFSFFSGRFWSWSWSFEAVAFLGVVFLAGICRRSRLTSSHSGGLSPVSRKSVTLSRNLICSFVSWDTKFPLFSCHQARFSDVFELEVFFERSP